VARREQFHRSDLVDSISATNPAFRRADAEFRNALLGAGLHCAPG